MFEPSLSVDLLSVHCTNMKEVQFGYEKGRRRLDNGKLARNFCIGKELTREEVMESMFDVIEEKSRSKVRTLSSTI